VPGGNFHAEQGQLIIATHNPLMIGSQEPDAAWLTKATRLPDELKAAPDAAARNKIIVHTLRRVVSPKRPWSRYCVMRNLRVVMDPHVVVRAALLPRSIPRQAFNRVPDHGSLLMSSATVAALAALNDVLHRPRLVHMCMRTNALFPPRYSWWLGCRRVVRRLVYPETSGMWHAHPR
jgi:hypothetical protein